MKTIIIEKNEGQNCWMADFGDDPEMLKLFGTGLIATAYTLRTPAEEVCRILQEFNPEYTVLISGWVTA